MFVVCFVQVAEEIVSSEESYVNNLKFVVNILLKSVQDAVDAKESLPKAQRIELSQDDIVVLFSNIQLIEKLNEKFLVDLKARLEEWKDDDAKTQVFFWFFFGFFLVFFWFFFGFFFWFFFLWFFFV